MVDKRLSKTFWSVLVIGGISLFSADGTATTHSDYLGPVDVVNTFDHKYLFIACLDGIEVAKFDLSSNTVVKRIQLSEIWKRSRLDSYYSKVQIPDTERHIQSV